MENNNQSQSSQFPLQTPSPQKTKKWHRGIIAIMVLVIITAVVSYVAIHQKNNLSDYLNVPGYKGGTYEQIVQLQKKFDMAKSADECKAIAKQIQDIGPYKSGDLIIHQTSSDQSEIYACISHLASKRNDQSLCDGNQVCLLGFLSRATPQTTFNIDCKTFGDAIDECFELMATAKMDSGLCSQIPNKVVQDKCVKYFAFRNHDSSKCNQLNIDYKIQDCKSDFKILTSNNVNICNGIQFFDETGPGKDACLMGFAIYNKTPDQCPDIIDYGSFVANECQRYAK